MLENSSTDKKLSASLWIIAMVSLCVIILSLTCGAAYTGIKQARLIAAKASIGQIESVFLMAELQAQEQGELPPSGSFQNLLRSYENPGDSNLSPYEKAVLENMLAYFGDKRDFDFAVTRYQDGSGNHVYVYYFPVKGSTDQRKDKYFYLANGVLEEHN